MIFRKLFLIVVLFFNGLGLNSHAEMCTLQSCESIVLPDLVKKFIEKGYSGVRVDNLKSEKFLFLTNNHGVNNCSVLFRIDNHEIGTEPLIGDNGELCNLSVVGNNVVSSWRDKGMWNNDVYQIIPGKPWVLLFNDSCIGCQQVKRTYFKDGTVDRTVLLSDGDDYSSRQELTGRIEIPKVFLYKEPYDKQKTKSYLIKDDVFSLVDMSDDGAFYKIDYNFLPGRRVLYWIRTDDFELQ